MADKKTQPKRAIHRPITVTIETVRPMPMERELPRETQMTINLKGNRTTAAMLKAEIDKQIETNDFFVVTIEGPA